MSIPYYDNPGGSLTVRVELQHVADVYLVDQSNLNAKQAGRNFTYFGGNYSKTPVNITVSGAGRWYLIVENGTNENYQYQWIK
jgi:hypothetical protein